MKAAVDRAVKEFGRLDIIYNNAGLGGAVGPLDNITVENWDKTLAILLRGVFLGMKHSIPAMRKVGGGSIISTASIAGIQGYAGIHAYSAAKAAVINLTRSAATELAKDKIRVNCICPGGINTPLIYGNLPGGENTAAQFLSKMQPMTARGASRRHREHGAVPRQRRIGMDHGSCDGGRRRIHRGGQLLRGRRRRHAGTGLSDGFAGPSFEKPKS